MIERIGNILNETSSVENDVVLCTCNSVIKPNGDLVMGKGFALECANFEWSLPSRFGKMISKYSINHGPGKLQYGLLILDNYWGAIQTKFHWKDPSPSWLVASAVNLLHIVARAHPHKTYHMPRPGCGNGGLSWENEVSKICKDLPNNVCVWSKENGRTRR